MRGPAAVSWISRLALALPLLALPRALQAQRLDGNLRMPSGAPAAGVVLTAVDGSGAILGRSVSRDDGSYALYLSRAGAIELRAKRVGYDVETVGKATVNGTEVVRLAAQLDERPAPLLQIPRGAATCGDGRGKRVADRLYEDVLTAAAAAQYRVGRQDQQARYITTQYRIAKTSDDTLRAALRRVSGSLPAPFPPADTARLEADGFFATIGGNRTFFAPDLEILASEWFLRTHCIRVRRADDDSVVLAMTPLRQRRGRVDVEGEFVLDWPTLALREFRFRYVDLPETERLSGAGGMLRFGRTPAGGWLITEWRQRTPFLNYFAGEGNTTLIRTQMLQVDVVAHFVAGGQVLAVADDSNRLVFQRNPHGVRVAGTPFAPLCPERTTIQPTAALRGQLRADSSDAPMANTVIRASWTLPVIVNRTDVQEREEVREAITDAEGRWFLCDIPLEREVTVRWETGTEERRIPVRATQAFSVVEVQQPR
ncbi:MAG: hypothetical protein C0503_06005 [Gemmatimonas sp.]|nr:hypothetical protein [Gemmatimonas sp.]